MGMKWKGEAAALHISENFMIYTYLADASLGAARRGDLKRLQMKPSMYRLSGEEYQVSFHPATRIA